MTRCRSVRINLVELNRVAALPRAMGIVRPANTYQPSPSQVRRSSPPVVESRRRTTASDNRRIIAFPFSAVFVSSAGSHPDAGTGPNSALQQTVTGVTPLALASFSQLLRPVSRKGARHPARCGTLALAGIETRFQLITPQTASRPAVSCDVVRRARGRVGSAGSSNSRPPCLRRATNVQPSRG